MDILFYVIIGVIALVGLYTFVKFLKKKNLFMFSTKVKTKKDKKIEKNDSVKLVEKYMYRREVKVLLALNQILPRTYLSLPKVSVGNITHPEGVRNIYNKFKDYFIDFVVFEEATMKPLLAVDIYDNSFEDELLKDRCPDLIVFFQSISLPILEFAVRNEVDATTLKEKLYAALKIDQNKQADK